MLALFRPERLRLSTQELVQTLLIEERNLQTLRLLILTAWIGTSDNIVRLAGHAGGDPSTCSSDKRLSFLTREVRQSASEYEHFASQYLRGGRVGVSGRALL